jgi:hypothetical protein
LPNCLSQLLCGGIGRQFWKRHIAFTISRRRGTDGVQVLAGFSIHVLFNILNVWTRIAVIIVIQRIRNIGLGRGYVDEGVFHIHDITHSTHRLRIIQFIIILYPD